MTTINELAKTVRACRDCKLHLKAKCPVPGVGMVTAEVMAVGQAPGWQEDRDNVPWIGQAGQFLTSLLESLGFSAKQVYFTNLVKCYPGRKGRGGDNEPPAYAIEACRKHLEAEIALVKPKVIVAVGAHAMRAFGIKGGINQNSGKTFDTKWGRVIPVLHPAGLMRRPTETPKFATSLNAIATALRPALVPPAPIYDFTPAKGKPFGLDVEVEDGKVWCAGIADARGKTAKKWVDGNGLTAILAAARAKPIFHNAKYDLVKLEQAGVKFKDWDDTILEAHMLGHHPLALKKLAPIFLGTTMREYTEVMGTGKKARRMDDIPEEVLDYCGTDAWVTFKLHELFSAQLKAHPEWQALYEKEKRLTRVLIDMEARGMPLDQAKLKHGMGLLLRRMGQVENILREHGIEEPGNTELIGQKFWRRKPRVLTTKSGELSTKAKDMRDNMTPADKPWVEAVIEWRSLSKFKSTYLDNWKGHDLIHPSVNQTGTMTWRFSMSDPNLMNVAKSKVVPLYQLFVAPPGFTFISCDCSQGELRVLSNVSGDRNMIGAYKAGRDLHTETTTNTAKMGLFEAYKIDHPDEQRRFAKTINFGIAYGITDYGLAPRLRLKKGEAQPFIDAFYESYPEVRPWQGRQIEQGKAHGYVLTFADRPLYVPCVLAEEGKLYYHGEKQCMNFPIQGGLMEIVKDAMLRAPEYLVNQVHDELLYLCPDERLEEYVDFLKSTLPDTRHEVSYTWDIHTGKTWGDLKNIDDIWQEDEDDED